MAISTPCYCSREDVMRAMDIAITARNVRLVDDSVQSAARGLESLLNRRFYPIDKTNYFDWPSYQWGAPWRIRFDANELAANGTAVTAGGVAIPIGNVLFRPENYGPPYTYMELDRSTASAFSAGATPQRSVAVTGPFGYDLNTDPAGALAAAMNDTTGTAATVTDSSLVESGHLILIGTERMLIADRTMTQAGTLTLSGSGVTTALASDVTLATSGTGSLQAGETILIDAERMLVVDLSGSSYVVKRAWDGTVLATHSAGANINAPRLLTVTRGALGTAAATHLISAAVSRFRPPLLVKELNIAEAVNTVLQKSGGYSRTVGEGASLQPISGAGLADIRKRAHAAHGRYRQRVV